MSMPKMKCKICSGTGFIRTGKIIKNCDKCNSPVRQKYHNFEDLLKEHLKEDNKENKTTWKKKPQE